MKKPGALVITGYGINCDYETASACELAGFRARRVHINDVLAGAGMVSDHRLVVFPGGFSYGDDLGSGVAFALKVRFSDTNAGMRFRDLLLEYRERGGLVLGICNGFQILARLGLVPGLEERFDQQVTIAPNREWYFIDRWVRLAPAESPCVFTRRMGVVRMPVRHGEGRLIAADEQVLDAMERGGRAVLRYCDGEGKPTQRFPDNPNGSERAVAGVCDSTGRVFGLMPHPEAAVSRYQYPDWTASSGEGGRGDGFLLFRNAREYV